jgi:septum formation protein
MNAPSPSLILASTSEYRRQLLLRLQVEFSIESPGVDETPHANERPDELARRLALAKARAVSHHHPHACVIGSDQVCDLNGQPLGKPGGLEQAKSQLRRLSGQTVVFRTAVAVVRPDIGFEACSLVNIHVRYRTLNDALIDTYLRREPALDCAGSAKSEGLGIALLESVQNDDPTALIGLPLIETCRLLRAAGLDVLA